MPTVQDLLHLLDASFHKDADRPPMIVMVDRDPTMVGVDLAHVHDDLHHALFVTEGMSSALALREHGIFAVDVECVPRDPMTSIAKILTIRMTDGQDGEPVLKPKKPEPYYVKFSKGRGKRW
jgi:hypothetical protein